MIDFGIARHFKLGPLKDTIIFGSVGYAAPEQYGKAQTPSRSDIYSLGATLHQLLSGIDPAYTPFRFTPLHLQRQPVPTELGTLIMQMVDMDENKRPATMDTVRQELQGIVNELPTERERALQVLEDGPSQLVGTTNLERILPLGTTHLIYRGHSQRVLAVAWSPDGDYIASGGSDQAIRIWQVT